MTKKEIIKEIKKTLEKDVESFLKEKQAENYTVVINLETGDLYSYKLPPKNALKAAYVAQMMRRVGKINDLEFIVMYSASKEFKNLDNKIEFTSNNKLLRLGDFYAHIITDKKTPTLVKKTKKKARSPKSKI